MTIDPHNYRQHAVFTLVLIALSTLGAYTTFQGVGAWFGTLPVLVQILVSMPSVPAIYAALFFLFDRYLWKFSIFKRLGMVTADDLNGVWEGEMWSSYDNHRSAIAATLTIEQTASRIKVRGKFNESRSVSTFANFGKSEMGDQTVLYYFYRNEPAYDAPKTMAMHEGSAMLAHDNSKGILSGYYYSGRDRNNHGTIEVRRKRGSEDGSR